MRTPKFERNKMRRFILTNGACYIFKRDEVDDYKEPTGAVSETTVRGVFHQHISHVALVGSDAASVPSKQTPYIMVLYDETLDIRIGDYTIIDGIRYNVNGLNDINHWNVVTDISLEAVV